MINNHLDPYGYMIPEIFYSGEEPSPLNLVTSCACEFWYDGQDASTFTLNGVNVAQWDDKSGFGRHVTNAVDAQRPTYIPATGRVSFVSANSDYLQSAAFGAALVQPNTIFVVFKITGALGADAVIFDGRLVLGSRTTFYYTGNVYYIYASVLLINGATNANDNIHVGEFNGVASNYWINGVLVAGPGNSGANPLNGITLGANYLTTGQYADAEIMEVCGYNCLITAAERNAVTAYLNTKWGGY